MTALSKDKLTKRRARPEGFLVKMKVAASQTVYHGALVMLNASGYVVPAADTASCVIAGVAEESIASGSTAGADEVLVRRGAVHAFENDATNAIAQGDVGRLAYVKDDQTVQDASATNDVAVGTVVDLRDGEVWVHVGAGTAFDVDTDT